MKKIFALLFLTYYAFCGDIKPEKAVILDSSVLDLAYDGASLYASSAKGDIYLAYPNKLQKLFSLPKIKTPYNEIVFQKALSIDIFNKKIAIGAQDGNIYIGENGALTKSGFKTESVIRKALFVSDTKLIICLIDGQIALYDMAQNKTIYSTQISHSPLNDMALSADKKTAAIVGEAGYVYMFDAISGKLKTTYKNVNLDNIYKLAYKNSYIITAGQDRRATLLSDNGQILQKFSTDFLVYAVALNQNATKVAVACDEQNDICVYDVAQKSQIALAKGHNATLNRIVFIDANKFASGADDNKILIWSLK